MGLINRVVATLFFGWLVVGLTACSSQPSKTISLQKPSSPVDLKNSQVVQSKLKQQYRLWKGTPYKYGGTSLKGVDCSAFVQNTFRLALGHTLPRTTRTQIKKGRKVSKSALKPGDIVFFKIAGNALHNGVYLGQSKFIHASTSRGVTISNLNNVYWKKNYYTARRIN